MTETNVVWKIIWLMTKLRNNKVNYLWLVTNDGRQNYMEIWMIKIQSVHEYADMVDKLPRVINMAGKLRGPYSQLV